ncbi:MAG: fibronectin type III domain-containing protein, partial [Candidatus Moranbacteria bacterium]|nr:fibronectin type III domain-containing protein [Candidatus Moranbacteria bacterium]
MMIMVVKNIRVFFCVLFLMAGMFFAGEARAVPTIDPLTLGGYDASSITLDQPVVAAGVPPMVSVVAYIGDATLTHTGGGVVTGNIDEGPVDVLGGDYTFSGLTENTNYTILVVAQDSGGYSDAQTTQLTS